MHIIILHYAYYFLTIFRTHCFTAHVNGTLLVTPHNAFEEIDSAGFVYAILAYDSSQKRLYPETLEMAAALRTYFHERCGVALLDFAYPLNRIVFSKLYSPEPNIYVKPWMRHHAMFDYEDEHHLHPGAVPKLRNLADWGFVIPFFKLKSDPKESFHLIDDAVDEMSVSYQMHVALIQRIAARKMTSGQDWETLYGREMIYPIYENLLRDLSKTAFEITGDDENTRPFSVEHFQQKELFYATFSDMINHLNVNEELEKRFKKIMLVEMTRNDTADGSMNHTVREEIWKMINDEEKFPMPELLPKPVDIKPLLPKWSRLRYEL